MRSWKSKVLGLTVIQAEILEDYRGTFVETFNRQACDEMGTPTRFVRDAISTSSHHVLRGLHYDDCTWKLIQCLSGRIYFVVVDMRPESPTCHRWEAFVLSEWNRRQVLVPPQHANGHLVLSESCIFHYKMSAYYDPSNEKTLMWNDSAVNIHWPTDRPILSQRDQSGVRETDVDH
jgi:dTDP-4-dehydrorhamnose 3,5-epimerase